MDIIGHGKTPEDAMEDLGELIQMQISFALFKEDPSLIFHPASADAFKRFNEQRAERRTKQRGGTNDPVSRLNRRE